MFKRLIIFTSFAVLMIFAAATVEAQAPTSFAYGDVVQGELTADVTAIDYTLTAAKGDIVVLDMRRVKDSQLYLTAIVVKDASGNEIVNTTEDTNANNTVAGFTADTDGDYTVTATRNKYTDSTGAFELRATAAKLLQSGDSIKGLVTNKSADMYYALPADTDVKIAYTQTTGDYYLYFRVEVLDSKYTSSLSASSTAIKGITWTVGLKTEADYITIVSVGASADDYQNNLVSSKFTLDVE